MKRLLLPLLAALAMPTSSSYSSDLGVASFDFGKLPPRYTTEKYESLAKSNIFEWHCGMSYLSRGGGNGRNERVPCKIEFKNGKLIVDGSKGITPDQVSHWESGWLMESDRRWAAHGVEDLIIFYRDSDGMMKPALFAATGSRESFSFYRRFLTWMGSGK